jgi:hypothetical protein
VAAGGRADAADEQRRAAAVANSGLATRRLATSRRATPLPRLRASVSAPAVDAPTVAATGVSGRVPATPPLVGKAALNESGLPTFLRAHPCHLGAKPPCSTSALHCTAAGTLQGCRAALETRCSASTSAGRSHGAATQAFCAQQPQNSAAPLPSARQLSTRRRAASRRQSLPRLLLWGQRVSLPAAFTPRQSVLSRSKVDPPTCRRAAAAAAAGVATAAGGVAVLLFVPVEKSTGSTDESRLPVQLQQSRSSVLTLAG